MDMELQHHCTYWQLICFHLEKICTLQQFAFKCIYTRFASVKKVPDKQATSVLKADTEFCNTYSEPQLISCDNGGEFNLIQTEKTNHPSEQPAANGVVERFHQELGKLSRIFDQAPDEVYKRLNTVTAQLQLNSYLKIRHHDPTTCVFDYKTRKLHYNDLVWRSVPARKRGKNDDNFTHPHKVLKQHGKFS